MGRLTLAIGYILTGDRRLLNEYNQSFGPTVVQPEPSKEWLQLVKQFNASKPYKPPLNRGAKG